MYVAFLKLLKPVIAILMFLYIRNSFKSAATLRNRSPGRWFWIGMASFYGVFAVFVMGATIVNLNLPDSQTPDGFVTKEADARQPLFFVIGYPLSFATMFLTLWYLKQLPVAEEKKGITETSNS